MRIFAETYHTPSQRGRERPLDFTADYISSEGRPYRARLIGFETADVRIVALREEGGRRMRVRTLPGTLGAGFAWGSGRRGHAAPWATAGFAVVGPDTAFDDDLSGTAMVLRVGLAPAALARLRADGDVAATIAPWSRPGVFRPPTSAAADWRLQRTILEAVRGAERAAITGVGVPAALRCTADDVVGETVRLLAVAARRDDDGRAGGRARRRLVTAAIEFLDAHPDEPVSVAAVCRALKVSERTLQRAFREILGIGLQTYERERRLRCAHGAILARGDRESITAIAMSFGFWHLGRFAGAYRALYAGTPAETRRRVWGEPAAAPAAATADGRARWPDEAREGA